jgi:alginate O-acetyltransferase complex protein AlgI
VAGVAPLVVCKYTDFLGRSVDSLAAALGLHLDVPAVSLLLPIGISFYTFKSLSYLIEVYRDPGRVERHVGRYALAISFFPQIFAGPIERPTHFLPQLTQDRPFDRERASAGLRLMALGYFKKLVIADHLSPVVNQVYGDLHAHTGLSLVIAALAFSVQIYCDFSGYSDIATGIAQVFGFAPVENFRRPYFSRGVQEFWRRWHITLSTWFRDYLYFPLGGNRVHRARYYANLMVVFMVSGLWHGAAWTFVIWGALHGLYLVVGSASMRWRRHAARAVRLDRVPRLHAALAGVITFGLVTVAWVFFRAASLPDALYVFTHWAQGLRFQLSSPAALRAAVAATGLTLQTIVVLGVSLVGLVIVDALQEAGRWSGFWGHRPGWQRLVFYYAVVGWILVVGSFADNPFIYFQF